MSNSIIVSARVFSAIALFRAVKDVRYYLTGVMLQTGPTGAFLVATDGHTISVGRVDTIERPFGQFVLPADTVAMLAKIKPTRTLKDPTIEFILPEGFADKYNNKDRRQITIKHPMGQMIVAELGGVFPDWVRVCKPADGPTDVPVFYSPHYTSRVADAAALIHKPKYPPQIRPNGTSPGYAQLDIQGDVGAWVAPIRGDVCELPICPAWMHP